MAFDPRPRKRTVLTGGLQHPRQIPAPRTAWVIQIACKLLRALGCQFIEPINELGIASGWQHFTSLPTSFVPVVIYQSQIV